jgi:hypothetical protein
MDLVDVMQALEADYKAKFQAAQNPYSKRHPILSMLFQPYSSIDRERALPGELTKSYAANINQLSSANDNLYRQQLAKQFNDSTTSHIASKEQEQGRQPSGITGFTADTLKATIPMLFGSDVVNAGNNMMANNQTKAFTGVTKGIEGKVQAAIAPGNKILEQYLGGQQPFPIQSQPEPYKPVTVMPMPAPKKYNPNGFTPIEIQVIEAAKAEGINPETLLGLMKKESSFNPKAVSPDGAIGLGQLMPGTARELGVNPHHVGQNIKGSAKYLARMIKQGGGVNAGLAGYIGGSGGQRDYLRGVNRRDSNDNTFSYIDQIAGYGKEYARRLYASGNQSQQTQPQVVYRAPDQTVRPTQDAPMISINAPEPVATPAPAYEMPNIPMTDNMITALLNNSQRSMATGMGQAIEFGKARMLNPVNTANVVQSLASAGNSSASAEQTRLENPYVTAMKQSQLRLNNAQAGQAEEETKYMGEHNGLKAVQVQTGEIHRQDMAQREADKADRKAQKEKDTKLKTLGERVKQTQSMLDKIVSANKGKPLAGPQRQQAAALQGDISKLQGLLDKEAGISSLGASGVKSGPVGRDPGGIW